MKIAYVIPEFVTEKEFGGLAVYYDNISRLLAEEGHQIYIFVLSDQTKTVDYYPGITVEKVYVDLQHVNAQIQGSFIRERSRVVSEKLLAYMRYGVRFDVVQYANLWALGVERINVPTVVRISSYQPFLRAADQEFFDIGRMYETEKVSDYLEEIATLRADAVYSPSKCIADIIAGRTGRNITIIESPFYPRKAVREDKKLFEERLKNQKYILSFGTVKILKGAKLIGDSIYQVLSACPDLVWVFAGSEFPWKDGEGNIVSPKEYIREHAREYMDRVIFLGKLNQEELFPIVRHALFCVMPSRIDNLPNTCIEAMALGKVVIGTTGASFEQLIDNGRSGFLIERENKDALMGAIQYVYGMSEEQREEIGREAQIRIEAMQPKKITEQLIAFYLSVIKSFEGIKETDSYTKSVIKKYNDAMREINDREAERYILKW